MKWLFGGGGRKEVGLVVGMVRLTSWFTALDRVDIE
jgi:hypothetical protein